MSPLINAWGIRSGRGGSCNAGAKTSGTSKAPAALVFGGVVDDPGLAASVGGGAGDGVGLFVDNVGKVLDGDRSVGKIIGVSPGWCGDGDGSFEENELGGAGFMRSASAGVPAASPGLAAFGELCLDASLANRLLGSESNTAPNEDVGLLNQDLGLPTFNARPLSCGSSNEFMVAVSSGLTAWGGDAVSFTIFECLFHFFLCPSEVSDALVEAPV